MKTQTDLYTKIVLTVIAIFLGIIALKDFTFVSNAKASPLPLEMQSSSGVVDVNIVSIGGSRAYYGSYGLDVNVTNYSDFK